MRPSERVRALVAAFNAGNIDLVVEGFTRDVEIAIPIYRAGEHVGPPAWNGREQLRRLLAGRYETGSRIKIDLISDGDAMCAVVTINSSRQGQLAVTFQFNEQGVASRLVVFKQ